MRSLTCASVKLSSRMLPKSGLAVTLPVPLRVGHARVTAPPKSPRRFYARPSAVRSSTMAAVRSARNRTTELTLATLLRKERISGWRRGVQLHGRPDFCFRREQVAVFVDGCFWHGCPKCYRLPGSNKVFWRAKLLYNRHRDALVTRTLRASGWKVLRIWEHQLSHSPQSVVRSLRRALG